MRDRPVLSLHMFVPAALFSREMLQRESNGHENLRFVLLLPTSFAFWSLKINRLETSARRSIRVCSRQGCPIYSMNTWGRRRPLSLVNRSYCLIIRPKRIGLYEGVGLTPNRRRSPSFTLWFPVHLLHPPPCCPPLLGWLWFCFSRCRGKRTRRT